MTAAYPPAGFACGAFAGTLNACVVTPVELVRNRLAVQRGFVNLKYKGPIAVVKNVLKEEGIKGMWKGMTITSVRDFFGVGSYFATFHFAKSRLEATQDVPQAARVPLAGMCAGIAYWTTALPLDAVKTVIQTSSSPLSINNALLSFRSNPAALYRGYVMALCRGIPGSSITFTVQSLVSNWIDSF
jgi:solute carrier family 25 carnitine/acylcarnitine transporter 20/29